MAPLLSRLFVGAALAILASVGGSFAQTLSPDDKDSDGTFTGIAMITDDPDWYALFQKAETPNISVRSKLGAGEHGVLAILFSNAEPRNGIAKVTCDVTAFDPTGSRMVVDSQSCYEGPYAGPNILHPALLDLQFDIGADDAVGAAGFDITLRDAYSERQVQLKVGFTQGVGE